MTTHFRVFLKSTNDDFFVISYASNSEMLFEALKRIKMSIFVLF